MTYTESALTIEGINESAIISYFSTFNRSKFTETAALFAAEGELLAPFEKPIIGQKKIAAYLIKEAQGMHALPNQGILEAESDLEQYKVSGKVKTALFSVNVAWYFTLNDKKQIARVQIKLLASPQELLGLKSKRDRQ